MSCRPDRNDSLGSRADRVPPFFEKEPFTVVGLAASKCPTLKPRAIMK